MWVGMEINNSRLIKVVVGALCAGMVRYPCYTDINYEIDDYPK